MPRWILAALIIVGEAAKTMQRDSKGAANLHRDGAARHGARGSASRSRLQTHTFVVKLATGGNSLRRVVVQRGK